MNCPKCEATISDGAKFCGACGAGAPAPMTKSVCSGGHENDGSLKFCGECGVPMLKAVQEEFDTNLDAILAMTKSTIPDSFYLPDGEDDTDAELEFSIEDMAKGGEGMDLPEGVTALDPDVLLKAVSLAARAGGKAILAALQSVGEQLLEQRRETQVLAKAQASQMQALRALETGSLKQLEASVTTLGTARNPRKAQVQLMHKSVAGGDPVTDESPSGQILCGAALRAEAAGMIKSHDVSTIEEMVNRGLNLAQIAEMSPGYGAVLSKNLGAPTTH